MCECTNFVHKLLKPKKDTCMGKGVNSLKEQGEEEFMKVKFDEE